MISGGTGETGGRGTSVAGEAGVVASRASLCLGLVVAVCAAAGWGTGSCRSAGEAVGRSRHAGRALVRACGTIFLAYVVVARDTGAGRSASSRDRRTCLAGARVSVGAGVAGKRALGAVGLVDLDEASVAVAVGIVPLPSVADMVACAGVAIPVVRAVKAVVAGWVARHVIIPPVVLGLNFAQGQQDQQ